MRTQIFGAFALALAFATAARAETYRHAYNVEGLTSTLTSHASPAIGFARMTREYGPGLSYEEDSNTIPGDDLQVLISQNISPGIWDTPPNSIEYMDGMLVVTCPSEVHEAVKPFLEVLRSRFLKMVVVEADVVLVGPGVLEAGAGSVLTPGQVKAIDAALADPAKARLVASLRASGANRQHFHAAALSSVSYVFDFDTEIAQDAGIGDPVMDTSDGGYVLDVQPMIANDQTSVLMTVKFGEADAGTLNPFATGAKNLGIIEQPIVSASQTQTTVLVTPGTTLLLSATSDGATPKSGWQTLVLMRTYISGEPTLAWPSSKEEFQFAAYDVSALVHAGGEMPGPQLGRNPVSEGGIGTSLPMAESDSGVTLDDEALVEMVKANVAPETWADPSTSLESNNGLLFARNTAAVLKQVETFVDTFTANRARLVQVESWLIAIDEVDWRARRAAFAGADIPDKDWNDLLEKAIEGDGATLLGSIRTAGQNGTRFHSVRGTMRSILTDYDVEIAQSFQMLDPVVETVSDGMSLDVLPVTLGEGKSIQLDLAPSIVMSGTTTTFQVSQGGVVQQWPSTKGSLNAQILVNAGAPTLVSTSTRKSGDRREVVLFVVRAGLAK